MSLVEQYRQVKLFWRRFKESFIISMLLPPFGEKPSAGFHSHFLVLEECGNDLFPVSCSCCCGIVLFHTISCRESRRAAFFTFVLIFHHLHAANKDTKLKTYPQQKQASHFIYHSPPPQSLLQ